MIDDTFITEVIYGTSFLQLLLWVFVVSLLEPVRIYW